MLFILKQFSHTMRSKILSGGVLICLSSIFLSILLCIVLFMPYSSYTSNSFDVYNEMTINEPNTISYNNEKSEYRNSTASSNEKNCSFKSIEIIHHFKSLVHQNDYYSDKSGSKCSKFAHEKVSQFAYRLSNSTTFFISVI